MDEVSIVRLDIQAIVIEGKIVEFQMGEVPRTGYYQILAGLQLVSFIKRCFPCWDTDKEPMPDGTYAFTAAFPMDPAQPFVIPDDPEPTVSLLLGIFSLSLTRLTYSTVFEPSYFDLKNDFIRSKSIPCNGVAMRWLKHVAFGVRALRILCECLAFDWLRLTWRQFAWLIISLLTGGGIARWLFGL